MRDPGLEHVLPAARFDLANFGELVSDPSRATMLLALMNGRARPATELAHVAGITRSTASSHLARLLAGGLVVVDSVGRHRYFRLASDDVADAIEGVSLLSKSKTGTASAARLVLSEARTCYKHLAGRLGVALLSALERACMVGLEEGALALTPRGARWCTTIGIVSPRWPRGKSCLDWTERQPHLGGPLGALLTEQFFSLRWIARRSGGRAVRVTERGARELSRQLGLRAGLAR